MSDMVTVSMRQFQRQIKSMRRLADQGQKVRIQTGAGQEYIFQRATSGKTLLGCMAEHPFPDDIPFSTGEAWAC